MPLVETECPELVRKQSRFMVELTTNERQVWISILGLIRFDDDGETSGLDVGPKAVACIAEPVSVDTFPNF
jgi:preprotein translocase subunit Sec61beta